MAILDVLNKQVCLTTFHALLNNSIDPKTVGEFDCWLESLKAGYLDGALGADLIRELSDAARVYHDEIDDGYVSYSDTAVINTEMDTGNDLRKMILCKKVVALRSIL